MLCHDVVDCRPRAMEESFKGVFCAVRSRERPVSMCISCCSPAWLCSSPLNQITLSGAVLAGKTALFAALQGNSLPNLKDRSVATRMKRLRMIFDGRTGLFKSVPQDEFHVASLISVPEESGVTDAAVAQDNNSLTPAPQATRSASPSSSSNPPATRCSPHIRVPTPSLMEKETPTQPHIISATMQTVLTLLKSDLREGHIDLETFDFAGEAMFDSLPALFMAPSPSTSSSLISSPCLTQRPPSASTSTFPSGRT